VIEFQEEPKRNKKSKSNVSKIIGFTIISGLVEFIIIIVINMALFLFALHYKPETLPYVLGFFLISCIARFLKIKKS